LCLNLLQVGEWDFEIPFPSLKTEKQTTIASKELQGNSMENIKMWTEGVPVEAEAYQQIATSRRFLFGWPCGNHA